MRLFIFDDRVEIISPGNLPDHLTIEKIRSGNSVQRNPILASFASKGLLPYRGLGTGVRRALQDWPQIQFVDDRDGCLFTTRIERIKVQKKSNKDALKMQNAPRNAPLSELQKKILEMIKENSTASYEILTDKLGKDRTTVMRNIQKMKDEGFLRELVQKKRVTGKFCSNRGYWLFSFQNSYQCAFLRFGVNFRRGVHNCNIILFLYLIWT